MWLQAYNLRPDPSARGKPHAGCTDLDGVLQEGMLAWSNFCQDQVPLHLASLLQEADPQGERVLSFAQFRQLAGEWPFLDVGLGVGVGQYQLAGKWPVYDV